MKTKLTWISTGLLRKFEGNPQKMDSGMFKRLCESIHDEGFLVPLVVDECTRIISGYWRYRAAKALKIKEVPCIVTDTGGDEIKAKKLNLSLNRIHGEFNYDDLIHFISDFESEYLEKSGFNSSEIEELLGLVEDAEEQIESRREEEAVERNIQKDSDGATGVVKFKFGGFVTPVEQDSYEKFMFVYDTMLNTGQVRTEQEFIAFLVKLATRKLEHSNVRK